MAGPIGGYHGQITVATTNNYDDLTGELHRWSYTVNSDSYDATTFVAAPEGGQTAGYKVVAKGMYQVTGNLAGFWNTASANADYVKYQPGRGAVLLTLIPRGGGGVTDQSIPITAKLNNYQITVNKQSGLVSFTADFVGEGDLAATVDYS